MLATISTLGPRGGVSAIEPTRSHGVSALRRPAPRSARTAVAYAVLLVLILAFFALSTVAYAGKASTGELAFEPCDRCHPVVLGPDGEPTKPLPNGFKKHEIELEAHDILGEGDKACVVCHDEPTKNPGMLLTADGTPGVRHRRDLQGVPAVPFREVRAVAAGYSRQEPAQVHVSWMPRPAHALVDIHRRTAAFPRDRHGGAWRSESEREGFKPFASPPVQPPVYTPLWLSIMAAIGVFTAAGIVGFMILGRRTR